MSLRGKCGLSLRLPRRAAEGVLFTVLVRGAEPGAEFVPVAENLAVTDDIKIQLDAEGRGDTDVVSIDLGGQTIDRVLADLGGGNNRLSVENGSLEGRLVYRGGGGDDTLAVAENATVQGDIRRGWATATIGSNSMDRQNATC